MKIGSTKEKDINKKILETKRYHVDTHPMRLPYPYPVKFKLEDIDDYVREGRIAFTIAMGGDIYWTSQIISRIFFEAETGKIPISGAGYGGRYSNRGFDDIWFDMSEIVRPTRDGIHGREYISTIVNIGRKSGLSMNEVSLNSHPNIDIPFPLIFGVPPLPTNGDGVQLGILKAAAKLSTLIYLTPNRYSDKMAPFLSYVILLIDPGKPIGSLISKVSAVEFTSIPTPEEIHRIKKKFPNLIISVRLNFTEAKRNIEQLISDGIDAIHLRGNHYGIMDDETFITDAVKALHNALTLKGIRNAISLIVSGGIAAADHIPKIISRGADVVVLDYASMVALGCALWADEAYPCPAEHTSFDSNIAAQRLINLYGSWRDQTLEVLGAMGIREIRRLRGEIGRTMSFKHENERFKKLFTIIHKPPYTVAFRPGTVGDRRWTPELLRATQEQATFASLPRSNVEFRVGNSNGGFDRLVFDFEGSLDFKELYQQAINKPLNLSIPLNKRGGVQRRLDPPIYSGGMSFGSISLNVMVGRAMAAAALNSFVSTGEGGYPNELIPYKDHIITQVATGLFGVSEDTIQRAPIVEFKYAQGAKPGLGGHLLAGKVSGAVAKARGTVENISLFSPFPFHSVYSVEDHKKHVDWIKAINPNALICVKVSTPSDVDMVAVGSYYAGAHIINIDGSHGGTGAAPEISKKNIALPIEYAIPKVNSFLKDEGIRDEITLVASGGIRTAFDVAKAIALGADAVQVGSADLVAIGCERLGACEKHDGCPLGITTTDPKLAAKIQPETVKRRIVRLRKAWADQLKAILHGLGLNDIRQLSGRTDLLRYVEDSVPLTKAKL